MNKVLWFAPFGLTVVFAAWFGWRMGIPRSDSQIITTYAADYVKNTNGAPTDCEARPSTAPRVRMIIDCLQANGAGYRYVVDARGRLIARTTIAEPDT